jgi:hypothetical protein
MNQTELIEEMMQKQLKDINPNIKLQFSDMKRLCKYITHSIFDGSQCTIFNGYITNRHNQRKGTYINFYFNGSKVALHRLLYKNFVEAIDSSHFLRLTCQSGKVCCNLQHMMKFEKNKYYPETIFNDSDEKSKKEKAKSISVGDVDLALDFEN